MTTHIVVTRDQGVQQHKKALELSARHSMQSILATASQEKPLAFLSRLKYQPAGCDPLNTKRPLNFIEQLNQTFTYLATFMAADILFNRHPTVSSLRLNLGTRSGWDIESVGEGSVIAEVFAATSPKSNDKLNKDIAKVLAGKEEHKYVFFLCPGYEEGPVDNQQHPDGVVVWSLGSPNQAL